MTVDSRLPPLPVNFPVFTSITVMASVRSMISDPPDGRNTFRSRAFAICSSSRYSAKISRSLLPAAQPILQVRRNVRDVRLDRVVCVGDPAVAGDDQL